MKKLTIVFILLLGIACFCACSNTGEVHLSTTTETQAIVENTSETVSETIADGDVTTKDTTETITKKQNPPEYVPGSIPLLGNYYYDNQTVSRKYRLLYTMIPGAFLDLVPENDFAEWAEENLAGTTFTTNEMSLVMFVKQFNISRNDFNNAVTKYTEQLEEFGKGANINEENEVPNADVIYTFDNKIINRYYRYE